MQPGGFQYVLRYSCHPADVSALALATKLKLVAVADESGTVSLLDLLQVGGMVGVVESMAGRCWHAHIVRAGIPLACCGSAGVVLVRHTLCKYPLPPASPPTCRSPPSCSAHGPWSSRWRAWLLAAMSSQG